MPKTMQAIVWHGPGRVGFEQRPVPSPDRGEALIEALYNGLCSTDYPIVEGQVEGSWPGMIVGHEPVGRVIAHGDGVELRSIGERVVLDTMMACGGCRACDEGRPELCAHSDEIGFSLDGNWSDFAVAPAANLHVLPGAIGDLEGTMIEALTCQMGAVDALRLQFGETVAIIGSGVAALTFVQLARLKGAGHVAVLMRAYPDRVALAGEFGADQVVDAGDPARMRSSAQVAEDEGFDVTIDAVGTQQTTQTALGLARRGGRVLLYGLRSAFVDRFPLGETIFRNLTLIGRTSAPRMWKPAIDLVARGAVRLGPMIGEVIEFSDLVELLQCEKEHGGPLKRVVRVRGQ